MIIEDNDKIEIKKAEVKTFLIRKFQEWAEAQNIWRPTVTGFARHIGIKVATLDHFMNMRRLPERDSIDIIGRVYPDFYDIMQVDEYPSMTDPALRFVVKNWSKLTDETRDRIKSIAERGQ